MWSRISGGKTGEQDGGVGLRRASTGQRLCPDKGCVHGPKWPLREPSSRILRVPMVYSEAVLPVRIIGIWVQVRLLKSVRHEHSFCSCGTCPPRVSLESTASFFTAVWAPAGRSLCGHGGNTSRCWFAVTTVTWRSEQSHNQTNISICLSRHQQRR
jgi:hypothetical protein